jgi:hypothetical protein
MGYTHTAACFCGAVTIEVTGDPLEMGYCHCNSCRSHSGAPVKAFTLWKTDSIKVIRGAELLGGFNKTGMSNRRFCIQCGGHLMVDHPGIGLSDLHASKLPGVTFKPSVHLFYVDSVPMRDGLPKLKDFPKHAGGSGETVPEGIAAAVSLSLRFHVLTKFQCALYSQKKTSERTSHHVSQGPGMDMTSTIWLSSGTLRFRERCR